MKYKVTSVAWDITQNPPTLVTMQDGSTFATEIIDTTTNVLFSGCKNAWDVEDQVMNFWNRLNDSDVSKPYHTHRPTEKVSVVKIEKVAV